MTLDSSSNRVVRTATVLLAPEHSLFYSVWTLLLSTITRSQEIYSAAYCDTLHPQKATTLFTRPQIGRHMEGKVGTTASPINITEAPEEEKIAGCTHSL